MNEHGQEAPAITGWAEPRLARIYMLAEALAKTMDDGSTAKGLVHQAMSKIDLADEHIARRNGDCGSVHDQPGSEGMRPTDTGTPLDREGE